MAVRLIFRGFLTFVLACHNPVETPPEPICQSDKRIKGGSHFPAFYFRELSLANSDLGRKVVLQQAPS